jgi:hypothetical protein
MTDKFTGDVQLKWVELFVNGVEVDVRVECKLGATKEELQDVAYETLRKVVVHNDFEKEMGKIGELELQMNERCNELLEQLKTTTHNQPPMGPRLVDLSGFERVAGFEAFENRQIKKRQLKLGKNKKVEEVAYKWFEGKMSDKRLAETVFGLINEGAKE